MSRCFPYPPPGYTLSRASNEALIESIKLQKEREKAKDRKEKKRRGKNEKKKEKKEKRKEKKDNANYKLHDPDIGKSQTVGKIWPDMKHEFTLKGEAETEQLLERSCLTEEQGQPTCSSVPSTSSDSTYTSNKRKRHPSPLKDSRGHGNIIRIKFTSKRQNDSNASANALRVADFAAQNTDFNNLRDGRESSHSALKTDREQICSTSRPVESVTLGEIKITSVPRPIESVVLAKTGLPSLPNAAVTTSMQREELKYNKLFGSWSPPNLEESCLDEDLDWLFQSRKPDIRAEKQRKIQNDGSSCSNSAASWPRAQLLKELDIYALPFTVPF